MKVFFGSLTDLTLEVDAWVPTVEQGVIILGALLEQYKDHAVFARARLQRYQNYEERFIGDASKSDDFMRRVETIGSQEPHAVLNQMKETDREALPHR